MKIVYLLTNLNKKEGEKRFYIGGKSECRLEVLNNIPTIIDIKTERPYLGSATSFEMKQDILDGHIFSASILKIISNKENLLEQENYYIKNNNAVKSEEYYNLSEAVLGGYNYDHTAVINFFGEIRKDYNSSKSGISKRTYTAKKYGFDSIGSFSIWIYEEFVKVKSYTKVSEKLNCERHVPKKFIEPYDMSKCIKEVNSKNEITQNTIRDLYTKGASYHKIKDITGLEIPTISIYMKGFDGHNIKEYITARRKNLTEEELQTKIINLYMSGKSVKECSKTLGINTFSAVRYFDKYVRNNLKLPIT